MDKIQTAKDIIEKNLYITIATYGYKERKPGVTPVFFASDENYNFYWVSSKTAQHSQNIAANNEIACVMFNSEVPEGTGRGLYVEALAFEVTQEQEIENALNLLSKKSGKKYRDVYDYVDSSPVRVYKAVPKKIWLNIFEKVGSHEIDSRVEISLL